MKLRMRALRITLAKLLTASLLFSALSPALAATLFVGRADVLARMLGLPVQATPDFVGFICHQDTAEGTQQDDGSGSDSGHPAHGIYCSFCLTTSSIVAVPSFAIPAALAVSGAHVYMLPPQAVSPPSPPSSTQRSRAPPPYI